MYRLFRAQRPVQDAVTEIGISVLSASVTTFLSSFVLFFTYILFFVRFGQFIALTVLIASVFAFTLFLALLAISGRVAHVDDIKWLFNKCRLCCKRDETVEQAPSPAEANSAKPVVFSSSMV